LKSLVLAGKETFCFKSSEPGGGGGKGLTTIQFFTLYHFLNNIDKNSIKERNIPVASHFDGV
jgi:hypothetical protein